MENNRYIQIGVTALRDPKTGEYLPAVPMYIKTDAGSEAGLEVRADAGYRAAVCGQDASLSDGVQSSGSGSMKHITEVSFENMVILPPGPGKCKICAGAHDPAQPHNKDSLYYRMKFRQRHGRYPNWTDAIEHCTALAKARFVATEVSACPVWHSYEVASELELGGFTRTATDRERDDDKPEWAGRSLPQPFPSTNEKSRLAGDNASLGKHCRRTTQR